LHKKSSGFLMLRNLKNAKIYRLQGNFIRINCFLFQNRLKTSRMGRVVLIMYSKGDRLYENPRN